MKIVKITKPNGRVQKVPLNQAQRFLHAAQLAKVRSGQKVTLRNGGTARLNK